MTNQQELAAKDAEIKALHDRAARQLTDHLNAHAPLRERIAHLEALLVAVREQDVKHIDVPYTRVGWEFARALRDLPLPDQRAEHIRNIVRLAEDTKIAHESDVVMGERKCRCALCDEVRALEAEK